MRKGTGGDARRPLFSPLCTHWFMVWLRAETEVILDAKGYMQGRSPTPVFTSCTRWFMVWLRAQTGSHIDAKGTGGDARRPLCSLLCTRLGPSSNRKSYRCERIQAGTLTDPCFRFYDALIHGLATCFA